MADDKQKKPFFSRLIERMRPQPSPAEPRSLPKLFGQEPPDRKTMPPREKADPRPVIEKSPPRPHIGIDTMLTSEWWQAGTVRPGNFRYEAKVLFEPSADYGINEGEIFKLDLLDRDGERVARYDRGWDLEPEPGSPAAKAVQQIVAFYRENAKDMPFHETGAEIAEQAQERAGPVPAGNSNPMGFFERDPKVAELAGKEPSEQTAQSPPHDPEAATKGQNVEHITVPLSTEEIQAKFDKIAEEQGGYGSYYELFAQGFTDDVNAWIRTLPDVDRAAAQALADQHFDYVKDGRWSYDHEEEDVRYASFEPEPEPSEQLPRDQTAQSPPHDTEAAENAGPMPDQERQARIDARRAAKEGRDAAERVTNDPDHEI